MEVKLIVSLPHTEHYKQSFSYSGVVLWNSLPCSNLELTTSLIQITSNPKQASTDSEGEMFLPLHPYKAGEPAIYF